VRYFVPRLEPPDRAEPQRSVRDKLGGLPWGLQAADWPLCSDCGKPQTHLVTLLHDEDRLDLGASGRALMVFQCEQDPGMCDTWSVDGGASVAMVIDVGSQTMQGPGEPPGDDRVPLGTEALITAWTEADDGVYAEQYPLFFRDASRNDIEPVLLECVHQGTKVGGVPYWIQGAEEGPGAGWRYVAQLDSVLWFAVDPGYLARARPVGTRWHADGPNFGDLGLAYVFVSDDHIRARMFWQCG
jgi:hypothetical protein